MSAPKFTDGPWAARNSNSVYGGVEINAKDSKIAYMFHRTRDWYDALLIASAPDFYASEAKNLDILKRVLASYQDLAKLMQTDDDVQLAVNAYPELEMTRNVQYVIQQLEQRIAETEQLLKKARGEE